MTVTKANPYRVVRPARRAPATHMFAIGQSVQLKDGFRIFPSNSAETYRITATLPPRGDMLQYRIRNEDERHERVTTEDALEAVRVSGDGATSLMARTFGHG